MRTVVRTLIAGVLAIMGTGVAGPVTAARAAPAAPVHGQGPSQQSSRATPAASSALSVSIDSVGPRRYATPGSTVVVKGTITNHTGAPLYGVQVRLATSSPFTTRSDMESFSKGTGAFYGSPISSATATWRATSTLHNGSTMAWNASFPVTDAGFGGFGVYPIEAKALSSGYEPLGSARTLLTYWPGSGPAAPSKLDIAWVWPLIDQPQQGACQQVLSTNGLASSLATGGRLDSLLSAGLTYASSTRLTWAVDPALLSDATVMTHRYRVGGNGSCRETTAMPAAAAAGTWLAQLRDGTAGDPMFVTPYADPDVSALTHTGLDADIAQSYSLGNGVASPILNRSFGTGSPVAWPAGGAADASVLTSLARDGQVGTTVLDGNQMPQVAGSQYNPDDAVARASTGIGTQMNVLLADSQLSGLLGDAPAGSPAGTQFTVTQDFLAETAMILAEAPNSQRSVVVAPPRRWDPSLAEADALLQLTSAPWLRPVSLGDLASGRAKDAPRQALPGRRLAAGELGTTYLSSVSSTRQTLTLFKSLLAQPSTAFTSPLEEATAVTESSAWRGPGSQDGWLALEKLQSYLTDNEQLVRIVSGSKVLLAGNSGVIPVSVSNGLPVAVQVRVHATAPPGSSLSVGGSGLVVTVQPNKYQQVRLPVHSAALGSTQVELQLVTRNGIPLPRATKTLSVQSTRFGRALLVLIGAALGVLVLTSLARWTRRWLRAGTDGGDGGDGPSGDGDGGGDAEGASDGARPGSDAGARAAGGSTIEDGSLWTAGRSGGTG